MPIEIRAHWIGLLDVSFFSPSRSVDERPLTTAGIGFFKQGILFFFFSGFFFSSSWPQGVLLFWASGLVLVVCTAKAQRLR